MTVGSVSAKRFLRHSSVSSGGLTRPEGRQSRGSDAAPPERGDVYCIGLPATAPRRGEGEAGAGSSLRGGRRQLRREGLRWRRLQLAAQAVTVALVALGYHCIVLWLCRCGPWQAQTGILGVAGSQAWDNGPACVDGDGGLKPGWVCSRRVSLQRLEAPGPAAFLEHNFQPGVPAVLDGLGVKQWDVFRSQAWSVDKLLHRYGHLSVYLQMGRIKDPEYIKHGNQLELRLPFREFLRMLTTHMRESNDYYLTANNYLFRQAGFQGMLRDITPLYDGFMGAADPDDPAAGVDIWMGPKGTVSPLHQDATSILFTQVAGRKLWRLISPDQRDLLYSKDGLSAVNLEKPWEEVLHDFPKMEQAVIISVTLEPGETLFLPNGWWHHVTSLDSPCISVSSSRWLPMFHEAEHRLHTKWSEYPWEVHLQG